jgi:antitoxin HicB
MSADPDVVAEYLARPYPISIVPQEGRDGGELWFAEVEDLPGCMSHGATPEEAVDRVRNAMGAWITVALDRGQEIPEPRSVHEYSGRFLVRTPRTLHRRLAREAQQENVSLNQFVTNALAASVGWRVVSAPEASAGERERARGAMYYAR